MLADLKGKTALVTGAGMGIGRGIALVLAQQGADVALTDLKVEWAANAAKEIKGVRTLALELDVTSQQSVDKAFARVLSEWGHLDILVNNAGMPSAPGGGPMSNRMEDWDVTFDINLKGTVRCCNAVAGHMKERKYGKIVNIASMAGHAPRKMGGAYAASKGAVLRYTKGLAVDLAPFNINVNAVCPGAVWTRFQQENVKRRQEADPTLRGRDPYEVFLDVYGKTFPLGRPQTVEDVGKAVAFLVSDDACNTTGQCLHVDGGAIIRD
jgi:NAD(P)-dependent dehydrogenase (short-subunit alcohol dehydrogenase family)